MQDEAPFQYGVTEGYNPTMYGQFNDNIQPLNDEVGKIGQRGIGGGPMNMSPLQAQHQSQQNNPSHIHNSQNSPEPIMNNNKYYRGNVNPPVQQLPSTPMFQRQYSMNPYQFPNPQNPSATGFHDYNSLDSIQPNFERDFRLQEDQQQSSQQDQIYQTQPYSLPPTKQYSGNPIGSLKNMHINTDMVIQQYTEQGLAPDVRKARLDFHSPRPQAMASNKRMSAPEPHYVMEHKLLGSPMQLNAPHIHVDDNSYQRVIVSPAQIRRNTNSEFTISGNMDESADPKNNIRSNSAGDSANIIMNNESYVTSNDAYEVKVEGTYHQL